MMDSDPLSKMPLPLQKWLEKQNLDGLLRRYGWSICQVCGRIGIRWTTEWLPSGINLEFESPTSGWIHPAANGLDGAESAFRNMWQIAEEEAQKEGRELSETLQGHEGSLFDLFMKGICNTVHMPKTLADMKTGTTNPFDMCVWGKTPFGKRQGGKQGVCPKCGEPGTGEGVIRGERRFFHSSSHSCYLGMVDPVRKSGPQIECPKCGELGRKSVSKGYEYVRHSNKTCYIGKSSDETPNQHSGTVRSSNETTVL